MQNPLPLPAQPGDLNQVARRNADDALKNLSDAHKLVEQARQRSRGELGRRKPQPEG